MKKLNLFLVSLFLVVSLSGCSKGEKAEEQVNLKSDNPRAQEEMGVIENTENAGEENNVVAELKNAISSGKKMQCTYTGEGAEVVTYLQGDKYKTEVMFGEVKTISIFDGDVMYSWADNQKTGTKMAMDCINSLDIREEAENEMPAQDSLAVGDGDEFVEELFNAQDLNCQDAQDVNFDIPADINFIDQCEMLKSQQQMIEDLNK